MNPRPWDQTHPQNFFRKNSTAEIEARISKIESYLREKFGVEFELFCSEFGKPKAEPRKKRGPKPAISDEHLFSNRDRYVQFFESYWPELRGAIKKANRAPSEFKQLLERIGDPRNGPHAPIARTLLLVFEKVVEVIRSKEYIGDPRYLANAMAGVPRIAWSTSLKRCRAHPSAMAIGQRALSDYVQRNFRSVYIALKRAKSAEDRQELMLRNSTPDREYGWLRDNPKALELAFATAEPREIVGSPDECYSAIAQDEAL